MNDLIFKRARATVLKSKALVLCADGYLRGQAVTSTGWRTSYQVSRIR